MTTTRAPERTAHTGPTTTRYPGTGPLAIVGFLLATVAGLAAMWWGLIAALDAASNGPDARFLWLGGALVVAPWLVAAVVTRRPAWAFGGLVAAVLLVAAVGLLFPG